MQPSFLFWAFACLKGFSLVGTAGEVVLHICKPHFCLIAMGAYRATDSNCVFISLRCLRWAESELAFATSLLPSLPPLSPQIICANGRVVDVVLYE